ncbi:hypothetical protein [Halocola ammonii]
MTQIEKLQRLDNSRLVDVVRNYRQYGYDEDLRMAALKLLEERGIPQSELEITGKLENRTYDDAEFHFESFKQNSKKAFVCYLLFFLFLVLPPIATTGTLGSYLIVTLATVALFIAFVIFLIRAFINQSDFYKELGQNYGSEGAIVYLLLGLPLYFFMYFVFRNQMKEKLAEIQ